MTLDEAIAIQTEERREHHSFNTDRIGQAALLLIGAGKRIIAWRNDNNEDLLWDLPGETSE
ncbi:hypothetical protein ES703_74170 [subsurface metagenome]